ncbi:MULTISPECIES: ABC transporter permease [unclassified Achromobacter]|uniref:ABC transporter permease n=1 Tax=unclassified Achromobacter TaxID=2626865 RepID=UPI000B519E18|nr:MULTISPECIES: ABC transporter permease [unclassified Achromobacter]OWT80117.1 nitrate ABC transporter permease [Achromobacter sp. HZ34]OWT82000.1 nitrate ABC transporter permease [Achromobacter sp. HZ28]
MKQSTPGTAARPAANVRRGAAAPTRADARKGLRLPILIAQRAVLAAAFVLVWWLAARHTPAFILPGPERVLRALGNLSRTDAFLHDIGMTMYRVVCGFVLAALIGTPLGLALGSSRALAQVFEPLLAVMNTISSAIWAVFAIIWFGISNATTVFVVFMTAMPLILTNVWQGAQNVDKLHVDLARSFRMTRLQILRKIYLPSILPYFFSGARLAFGFGWRVSLVAETLGSSDGIGYRLRQAADLVQTDQVFAWTLLLVVLMLLLESGVLKPLERRLFRWKPV